MEKKTTSRRTRRAAKPATDLSPEEKKVVAKKNRAAKKRAAAKVESAKTPLPAKTAAPKAAPKAKPSFKELSVIEAVLDKGVTAFKMGRLKQAQTKLEAVLESIKAFT